MAIKSERYYTYEDWVETKHNNPDKRVELIDGVLYIHEAPSPGHQSIVRKMYAQISNHLMKVNNEFNDDDYKQVSSLDDLVKSDKT